LDLTESCDFIKVVGVVQFLRKVERSLALLVNDRPISAFNNELFYYSQISSSDSFV
jgi:hypothetical protein